MAYLGNAPVVGDSTNSFKLLDDIQSFTVTFDATDTAVVSIANNTLTFRNHRFITGQRVTYNDGGGTAIGGLADGVYFIIKVDQNTIQLATNASNAASSTAIDLTSGAAGGSHTLNVAFDGVNTKFKATHSNGTKAGVSRAGQLSLSINGVIQQPQDNGAPTVGYGIQPDSTIIFSTPPASVDKVFGTFIGEAAASFDIDDNTVDNFTGDGSTASFNLSKDVPSSNDVLVTLDGVTQYPTDSSTVRAYSVVESTLTFVSAPDAGVAIQVRHIGFAGATSSAVTGFYGRTGNAALRSTDDITFQNASAGIITASQFVGVGTLTDLSVSGIATFASNVSIAGTLTYEDVTNIDSVGLITARNGIVVGTGITLSKDGDGFFTGVVTATSYAGDGSGLTGVAGTENIRTNTNATFLQNINVGVAITAGKLGIGFTDAQVKIGNTALDSLTTGTNNTAVGHQSLTANTTGTNNTSVGSVSLTANTTGQHNTAVGMGALNANTTAGNNTAVGRSSLANNTTGGSNTALGSQALISNTTADNNTGIGYYALHQNTTGTENTAVGAAALDANTTASANTAIGYAALSANTTGGSNTAIGQQSLQVNTTTSSNTALGKDTLRYFTASNNTAIGVDAMQGASGSSTGGNNVAVGYNAGLSITTGSNNTIMGSTAGDALTTGGMNIAIGQGAMTSATTGNYNVAVGRAALSDLTTNDNNTAVGYAALNTNTASSNTALGYSALSSNTTGNINTAVGKNALTANTTSNYLTAVGQDALAANTDGTENVAVGSEALKANTTGSYNTGLGHQAGEKITTGSSNIVIGARAGDELTTAGQNTIIGQGAASNGSTMDDNVLIGANAGYNGNSVHFNKNVAVGNRSMYEIVDSKESVAIGYEASYTDDGGENCTVGFKAAKYNHSIRLTAIGSYAGLNNNSWPNMFIGYNAGGNSADITGSNNTAVGYQSLEDVTTGGNNTAVGYRAMGNMTTGGNNVCVGSSNLDVCTTGNYNVALGHDTARGISSGGNNVCLGHAAGHASSPSGNITTGSNNVVLGNNSISNLYCADTSISSSDARDKTDVTDFTHGLSWIKELRPVTYRWDRRSWYTEDSTTKGIPDGSKKRNRIHIGFIAQEAMEVEKKFGYAGKKDDMLIVNQDEDELDPSYGIKYERLVPVLVNAIKELSAKVEELESKLN